MTATHPHRVENTAQRARRQLMPAADRERTEDNSELASLYRQADVLVGRQREALADVDRAYTRMLREQEDARERFDNLTTELHAITDRIRVLRERGATR